MGKISGEVRQIVETSRSDDLVEVTVKLTPHGLSVGRTPDRVRRVFELIWSPIAERVTGFGGRILETNCGAQTARCLIPAGCIFELSGVENVCSIDLPTPPEEAT